jgi:hypothetical protein
MIGFQSARFVQTPPLPINVTMPVSRRVSSTSRELRVRLPARNSRQTRAVHARGGHSLGVPRLTEAGGAAPIRQSSPVARRGLQKER